MRAPLFRDRAMPNMIDRLKTAIETGAIDPALLPEVLAEMLELRKRGNDLETVLIMLVRTGWPWQENGEPNEILLNCKDGYASAIVEAKELLGLGHRSTITRTEPPT